MKLLTQASFIAILILLIPQFAHAQMQRKRAFLDSPINDIFLGTRLAGTSTVSMMEKGDLNFMIMHNFGEISTGIDNFYGIDGGANIRLAFDYGLTDRLNIGIGRTSVDDNVDLTSKIALLQQMESNRIPLSLVLKVNIGITTEKSFDISFTERLNFLASLMIARKFSDTFSLQIAPMYSHFNTIFPSANEKQYNSTFGIGMNTRFKMNERKSLSFEYLPIIANKNSGIINHLAVVYEIETGGHIFQIFLMSGRMFTEQHLLARNKMDFFEGDFRLGFNINRVFGLAK